MKIDVALRDVHDAERELGRELLRIGERHKADHDVFHLTRTLTRWCDRNMQRVARHAERYGTTLDADADADAVEPDEGLLSRAREKGAELVGRRPEPGLLLLHDLRETHLAAVRASVAWTILGQGAQAVEDEELLATVTASHPETIRTMKWTLQKMKDASPQVLAS
jgi:hypothetical protein